MPHNLTVQTTAVRARLVCSPTDYLSNSSLYLQEVDFNNATMWNATNKPPNLSVGYQLRPGFLTGGFPTCCSNITNGIPGQAAIGYWSDSTPNSESIYRSMTAKWAVGYPLDGLFSDLSPYGPAKWIWSDRPRLVAFHCEPVVEQATASVTVDASTGVVRSYIISEGPKNATGAWSDNYLSRNVSSTYTGPYNKYIPSQQVPTLINTTTRYTNPLASSSITLIIGPSYGHLFWDALLTAANVQNQLTYISTEAASLKSTTTPQNPDDHVFNFRIPGLNVDFMSYSMLALANNDKEALLDPKTFVETANTVFGIFFKHYVSNNVTMAEGGPAYQRIGAALPADLGPPVRTGAGYNQSLSDTPATTIKAKLQTPVDRLVMSPTAVFLCLAILALLCLITVVIYAVYHQRFRALPRDVDTLASVLGFVYGSERLLHWVHERQHRGSVGEVNTLSEDEKTLKARLGPFATNSKERWGVELTNTLE
jgi:hypothetical protein